MVDIFNFLLHRSSYQCAAGSKTKFWTRGKTESALAQYVTVGFPYYLI